MKRCPYYGTCVPRGEGYQCLCLTECRPAQKPVCGSNLKTYESKCVLRMESCLSQTKIEVIQESVCGKLISL